MNNEPDSALQLITIEENPQAVICNSCNDRLVISEAKTSLFLRCSCSSVRLVILKNYVQYMNPNLPEGERKYYKLFEKL
jgi:ssDNA-binding Zn-finger/Zn-ribbon topoisomerase 1